MIMLILTLATGWYNEINFTKNICHAQYAWETVFGIFFSDYYPVTLAFILKWISCDIRIPHIHTKLLSKLSFAFIWLVFLLCFIFNITHEINFFVFVGATCSFCFLRFIYSENIVVYIYPRYFTAKSFSYFSFFSITIALYRQWNDKRSLYVWHPIVILDLFAFCHWLVSNAVCPKNVFLKVF